MALTERKFRLESHVGGLGLSCTADGVSLAGVPLLRKTTAGLAPRPIDEFAALMKSAYGFNVDPSRSYPGLNVIAHALNQGDIGRAMVAAIHLKLPDLNEERAALIAGADQLLNKYDPDEPRDERGRWTSGDGSSSSRSVQRIPNMGHSAMKPIPASYGGIPAAMESYLVNDAITRQCIHNAEGARYYEKTQMCAAVMRGCESVN